MKRTRHIISSILCIFSCICLCAQEKVGNSLEFDKLVHNFGNIIHKSGPVSCSFTIRNKGSKPAVIYNVVSTCGCTDVEWTKEPIRPGGSGKITATYSNDEGAYPFDKVLTVYLSDVQKPVLLKFRGVSTEKEKPLSELYPVSYGPLAFRESLIKCGNLEQGNTKSESVLVANTSDSPIAVSFKDTDPNLTISLSPNPIPAKSTAEMRFSVKANRNIWGKHTYYTTPLVNGAAYKNSKGKAQIGIWAFTKENFTHLTKEEKAAGSRPTFTESTYSFGKVKRGTIIHASFTFKNDGKSDFVVYKVNSDAGKWSHSTIPATKPGGQTTFSADLDTSDLPVGESLTIITLTTNSPLRPIVNLFIAGYIE